jgi:hypothetical protein
LDVLLYLKNKKYSYMSSAPTTWNKDKYKTIVQQKIVSTRQYNVVVGRIGSPGMGAGK